MAEMIPIDKSRIPAAMLDAPRVKELEARYLRSMSDKKYRLRICIHEAAHIVYKKQRGATSFKFEGPIMDYDAVTDTLCIKYAGVGGSGYPAAKMPMRMLSKECVAGRVAEMLLTETGSNCTDTDTQDFADFKEQYDVFADATEEEILQEWEAAKQDVERDLRSPAFCQEIWAVAREFEQKVFGVLS